MVTRVLFGVQDSPHHKACVALAWLVAIFGLAVGLMQGWSMGVPVVLVGLIAVAVLSRQTATHHEKTATRDQLSRVTAERDEDALRTMVEHSPHDPNEQLAEVSRRRHASEIEFASAIIRN